VGRDVYASALRASADFLGVVGLRENFADSAKGWRNEKFWPRVVRFVKFLVVTWMTRDV
jgi:hypothetical protein